MPNPAAATAARRRSHDKPHNRPSGPLSNISPIAPQFAASSPTTLLFKEKKIASGNSGKVVDAAGDVVFEIESKLMTISNRRVVKDAQGTEVGQVRRQKTPNVHNTTYLGTMNNEKKCAVKCKGTTNASRKMGVTSFAADVYVDHSVVGVASGNWTAKSFQISILGTRVARASKETSSVVVDADSYCVEIHAHVDSAFITMIVLALDEICHEDV